MSDDHSSNGHKSWLDKLAQAFNQEPKTRQELFALLREAIEAINAIRQYQLKK